MKHVCAWCAKITKITCDHCGETLLQTEYVGSTFLQDKGGMVCVSGPTTLHYSAFAIARMKTSHGLCDECAALGDAERDERARARLAAALAEITNADPEKRGPMGVPKEATPPPKPKGKTK